MTNADLEERVVLDGDADTVRRFLTELPRDIVRHRWIGQHEGHLAARLISPAGSLAYLAETDDAFELRVLADRTLAARLAEVADSHFGVSEQAA